MPVFFVYGRYFLVYFIILVLFLPSRLDFNFIENIYGTYIPPRYEVTSYKKTVVVRAVVLFVDFCIIQFVTKIQGS
jgi:hypothetical protein